MVLATYMCFQGLSIHYESIFVVLEHLPKVLSPAKVVLSLISRGQFSINILLQSDTSFSVAFEDLLTHFTNLKTIHIRGWKVYFFTFAQKGLKGMCKTAEMFTINFEHKVVLQLSAFKILLLHLLSTSISPSSNSLSVESLSTSVTSSIRESIDYLSRVPCRHTKPSVLGNKCGNKCTISLSKHLGFVFEWFYNQGGSLSCPKAFQKTARHRSVW